VQPRSVVAATGADGTAKRSRVGSSMRGWWRGALVPRRATARRWRTVEGGGRKEGSDVYEGGWSREVAGEVAQA